MSDKRLNDTIFLMFLATDNYKRAHAMLNKDFLKLDKEFSILNYISECPVIFDSMTGQEMVREIVQYGSAV